MASSLGTLPGFHRALLTFLLENLSRTFPICLVLPLFALLSLIQGTSGSRLKLLHGFEFPVV